MSLSTPDLGVSPPTQDRYDAFLSHNSADKPAVEKLAQELEKRGLSCWLDTWNLVPGDPPTSLPLNVLCADARPAWSFLARRG